MKAKVEKSPLEKIKNGLLCIFLLQEQKPPAEIKSFFRDVDKKRFEGKLLQTFATETLGQAGYSNLLVVGLGPKKEFKLENLRRAGGAAVRHAASIKQPDIIVSLDPKALPEGSPDEQAQAITEGVLLSELKLDIHKSKKEDEFSINSFSIGCRQDVTKGVQRGVAFAGGQNFARALDEEPANIATPSWVADQAKKLGKEHGISVTVFDKAKLKQMKMNCILAVSQGSIQPPVLIRLEYNKGKKYPLYTLVGKGITFDSGGISLKPAKDMHEMKYDKSGAIDVLGIFKTVAMLKLPVRLLGLVPLVENLPSGSATKPGDIVTAYNGKTVEIIHTDAEGRLILADVLSYAAEHKPQYMIDMATLTGAMVISLGRHAIGMFSTDDRLAKALENAGEATHERVWRLPLWPEYGEMMKSDIADLKNISELPEAGSITAAAFLKEFVGDVKWAHLDIAAVEATKPPHPYLGKGASGTGVRLVTKALENLAKKK